MKWEQGVEKVDFNTGCIGFLKVSQAIKVVARADPDFTKD